MEISKQELIKKNNLNNLYIEHLHQTIKELKNNISNLTDENKELLELTIKRLKVYYSIFHKKTKYEKQWYDNFYETFKEEVDLIEKIKGKSWKEIVDERI